MTTIYVFQVKSGVEAANWDEIDIQRDCEIVAEINGKNNSECEAKLKEMGIDEDTMGAGYGECAILDRAEEVKYID